MIREYSEFVSRRMKPTRDTKLTEDQSAVQHMLTGIATEFGELSDSIKRHHFYEQPLDMDNCEEEAGDLFFYLFGLCALLESQGGASVEQILAHNVAKLTKRYPEGYSNENAAERMDKS